MGNMEALFRIGYCYEFGINVDADPKKAIECYERAAEAGFAVDAAIQRMERDYYNQLVTFLQSQWKAVSPSDIELDGNVTNGPVVDLSIEKDGKVVKTSVVSMSGNRAVNDAVTTFLANLKIVPAPPQTAVIRVALEI